MRMKKPYIATLDQVKITRQGEYGIIEYIEPNVSTTHLKIGPGAERMTDQEILDQHDRLLRAQHQMALEYEHVAIEVPPGHPQIEYHALANQWTHRGAVLRCVIDDAGPDGEAVIYIDDQELSLGEFGRLLTTYAGWGMRIAFVPDDEACNSPQHRSPRTRRREGPHTIIELGKAPSDRAWGAPSFESEPQERVSTQARHSGTWKSGTIDIRPQELQNTQPAQAGLVETGPQAIQNAVLPGLQRGEVAVRRPDVGQNLGRAGLWQSNTLLGIQRHPGTPTSHESQSLTPHMSRSKLPLKMLLTLGTPPGRSLLRIPSRLGILQSWEAPKVPNARSRLFHIATVVSGSQYLPLMSGSLTHTAITSSP